MLAGIVTFLSDRAGQLAVWIRTAMAIIGSPWFGLALIILGVLYLRNVGESKSPARSRIIGHT